MIERPALVLRCHRPLTAVEEADVAAERNRGDAVFGAVAAPPMRFQIGLPKPMEKRSTFMPAQRPTM